MGTPAGRASVCAVQVRLSDTWPTERPPRMPSTILRPAPGAKSSTAPGSADTICRAQKPIWSQGSEYPVTPKAKVKTARQQAACTLNHKCHEHQAAKAVKKTNVRRDIFSCRGINKALSFNALLEPIERDEKRNGQ